MQYWAKTHATELVRRELTELTFTKHMSPKQRAFIFDPSPARVFCTGRQSGKTTADALLLLLTALRYPNELCGYVALTRKNAKLLMWLELQDLNDKLKLGFKFNNSDLVAYAPNGSRIWLSGADNEASIEKFRGFRFKLIILDEAQAYGPYIHSLVVDVIDPGLIAKKGSKAMSGTPSAICAGYFHDACNDPRLGWSRHHATVLDNPYVPHAAEWLAAHRLATNMPQATYDREWMGLWVPDLHSLVYHYSPSLNGWNGAALPHSPQPWEYGLGVDLGYDPDPMAFVVVAWNRHNTDMHVVKSETFPEMLPTDAALHIKKLDAFYHFNTIVADGGGQGKGIVAEWRKRYDIPVWPAKDKHLKKEHIQLLNDDLRMGRIKIKDDIPLAHELKQVLWDDKREEVSDRYPNDMSDAFEYIWVASKHFAAKPIKPPPVVGTEEWAQREADRYERLAIEKAKARVSEQRRHGW